VSENGSWVIGAVVLICLLGLSIYVELKRRKGMSRYWARTCAGREWKTKFPSATKEEIREFLNQFVDGFAYSRKKRLKFSPDDRVLDVYHAENPEEIFADALELETFARNLQGRYGVDLAKLQRPDITLGDVFELSRRQGGRV
jgi:hypothetical protein